MYFESSPSTYQLYNKMGYETLDEKTVHKAELVGTAEDIEVPLMVKMPACAGGMTFKEWRGAGYPPFGQDKKPLVTPAVDITSAKEKIGNCVGVRVQVREVQV